MSEIIHRSQFTGSGQVVRMDRSTAKALDRIRNDTAVRVANEVAVGEIVNTRIKVDAALTRNTIDEAVDIHDEISMKSHGDPLFGADLRMYYENRFMRRTSRVLDAYEDRPL